MDLIARKALLAMLAQAREHADNAVKWAPLEFSCTMNHDGSRTEKMVPSTFAVELRESNRLLANVLEKLIKDPVG